MPVYGITRENDVKSIIKGSVVFSVTSCLVCRSVAGNNWVYVADLTSGSGSLATVKVWSELHM